MLSWPDFEEKQIIYIESGEIKNLSIQNGNLASKEDGKTINQIPLSKIFAVFLEGSATFTSTLIRKLIKNGSILVLMTRDFRTYCILGGETEGNVLLREKQYTDKNQLKKAQWIVSNKIQNQLALIKDIRKKDEVQKKALKFLKESLEKIETINNPKSLLGIEGGASKMFFSAYFGKFKWHGRKPRTKFDEKNTLMDIGYTFLFNFIEAHLRLYGFDLYRGFYHTDFYQRKSLACDLIEPFRSIIDHALYRALALKQFDEKDFEVKNGEYHLKTGMGKKYIKIFLEAIMGRKEEIFKYLQTYYREIMKDQNDYPEFLIKTL